MRGVAGRCGGQVGGWVGWVGWVLMVWGGIGVGAATEEFAVGADLSFLKQAEDGGTVFREGGEPRSGWKLFHDHGYTWVRLRLFHTPPRLPNDLGYTIASAQAARRLGFKWLLDLHYSDTWADPAKQIKPRAWEGKSGVELVEAVRGYTRETLVKLGEAGVFPEMVQIGNEVTPGMLWPEGKLPEGWPLFAEMLKAGVRGVEEATGTNARPRIMVHIDKGGDREATRWFFDGLRERGVAFDVIGQSYYPWWHGSLEDLRENLAFMATTYDKDIILVEVAYCWRPTEFRQRPGPFPETPEGQRQFLEAVASLVRATPNGRGRGVFWWEPAVTGRLRSRGFFDDDGNALPVLGVFDGWGGR